VDWAFADWNVPAEHSKHENEPLVLENEPGEQAVQAVKPVADVA
jgi:hypothetical protein